MTKLLDDEVDALRAVPASKQDEIARALISLTRGELESGSDEEELDPADIPGLLEGIADADAGRFATDEDMEAIFARFGK
jgi:predicted transcriptional regulator